MKIPRNVSPAAEARRTWLLDVTIGVVIGLFVIIISAGIGVVGFIALLAAIGLALWYVGEGVLKLRRRRAQRP